MEQVRHVVIVVSYNDTVSTIDFIKITSQFECVDKIVIVDNYSTNQLYEKVNDHIKVTNLADRVVCIKSDYNGGYAYGSNCGIKYAIEKFQPEYISVSNSDVILNETALKKCIDFIAQHDDAGIVAPHMETPREGPMRSFWKMPSFSNVVADNLIVLSAISKRLMKQSFLVTGEFIPVDAIVGSYYMCLTKTMEEIGFLDERTFLYCEENILAQKIKRVKKQNYILPEVKYIHNHSESINKNISSVSRRLSILHDSMRVYNKYYLRTNFFQDLVYEITYVCGKYSYLLARKILKIKR